MKLKLLPFSYLWIVRRAIGDTKTILDLGCGDGNFMKNISEGERWDITGIELDARSFKKAKRSGVYREVFKADVTGLPMKLSKRKFDVVFSSQVLEHLNKKLGEEALGKWEKLAKKRIVVTTPIGFIKYEPLETRNKEKNPLQKHLSGWTVKELERKGYKVAGQGARFIYGQNGLAKKFLPLLPIFSILSYFFAPLVYFYPKLGTYMVAYKEK